MNEAPGPRIVDLFFDTLGRAEFINNEDFLGDSDPQVGTAATVEDGSGANVEDGCWCWLQ